MHRLTRSGPAVFFAAYLAVQAFVPIHRLFNPRPARFGWQMFSAVSVPSRVWIVSGNLVEEISPASYIGNYRGDLDYETYVPPHICKQRDIQAVRYLMPLETTPREYKC